MDCISTESRDQFENMSFVQVYEYVTWELGSPMENSPYPRCKHGLNRDTA